MPGAFDPVRLLSRVACLRHARHFVVALFFGILLSAVPSPALAQDPAAKAQDSAANTPGLPDWFKELIDLVETNSEAARQKADAKLTAARLARDAVTEAYAVLMLSHAARRQNDIPTAIRLSRESIALAESLRDPLLLFNTNYGHALNLRAAGDYAGSVDFLLRARPLAEARPTSGRAEGAIVAALGSSYEHLGDLKRALEYKQRALALAEKNSDTNAVGMYAHNLAALEQTLGDLPAARRDFTRALAIIREEGNRTAIDDLTEQLAMLDLAEGHPETALTQLQPILARRRNLRGKVKLTTTLGYLSEILLKLNRADEALAYLEEARPNVEAIESRGVRLSFYHRLAAVQEARGDFAAALAAARREFAEREAISGDAAQSRTAELQVQFDVAKKDAELARLARVNEVQSAEARTRAAQLAQSSAELRAKDAELHAKDAELARTRTTRLAFAAAALAAAAILGAIVLVLRARIRAERRILADTRAARDTAQQADALKGRLLGFASHDLKAPLASLSNATHLIEESAANPAEVRSLAATMRAEASRMIILVHDFIDRAALDAGRLELRPGPLDLSPVIARVVADFRPRATQKDQVISVEEPLSSLPLVSGEAARLEQIVANLLSNAINYTPRRGSIQVVLGQDASDVWCEVRDTGPGIAPDDQARLFQPFARLSHRPTGGESSSGLGLYLAHELVRLHGGTLTVRSHPGAGATFRLTLPRLPIATSVHLASTSII